MPWTWSNIDWNASAAWVQAFGMIGAIVGTAWIASGQSREALDRELRERQAAERTRLEANAATLLAASRLVSIGCTKVVTLAQRLAADAEDLNSSHVGIPTRANHRAALRRLEAFPLEALSSADAVILYCRAIEVMELVLSLLEASADLCAKHPRLEGRIIAEQIQPMREFAGEIAQLDEQLREMAEPGWRERLKAKLNR